MSSAYTSRSNLFIFSNPKVRIKILTYLNQTLGGNLSKNWILLDNQRTLDQFVNDKCHTNMNTIQQPITIFCNAGCTFMNHKGSFGGISVWYNPNRIANVLSLKMVTDHYLVTYNNNDRGGVFPVHTPKCNIEYTTPTGP